MQARSLEVAKPGHAEVEEVPYFVESSNTAMRAIERVVSDIAPTGIPVLITGESGTGKEVMALRIHRLSQQQAGAFNKVSCASLSLDSLSGALKNGSNGHGGNGLRHPGTLFLDEISELDPACQPRLLSAIVDSEAEGNGAKPGARLISSTCRNLEEEMRAGRFREELYFRINGVCLRLPPLRHRKEDIPALLDAFLDKYAREFDRSIPRVPAWVLERMEEYAWRGNIRELENVARKMVALGDMQMALADLPGNGSNGQHSNGHEGISLKEASREASRLAERELILKVLARTRWNRKRAAQELKISYKALLYKLKQIGLEDSTAG